MWNHTRHFHGFKAAQFPVDNVLRSKFREEENTERRAARLEKPEANKERNKQRRDNRTKRAAAAAELAQTGSQSKLSRTNVVQLSALGRTIALKSNTPGGKTA